MVRIFVLFLACLATTAFAKNLPCNPDEPLKLPASRVGAYVRADIWKALPQAIDRDSLNPLVDKDEVLSLVISEDGGYSGHTNGWHEGGGVGCPVFEGKNAWHVFPSASGKQRPKKGKQQDPQLGRNVSPIASGKMPSRAGPFVKVSDTPSIEEPIFHRIFGVACFGDTRKREWCFDQLGLMLDKRRLNSRLHLDNFESAVPGFEVTVSVAKDRSKDDYFLGFVRSQTGWTVYRLSRAAFDRSPRPVWSPDKMPKPWETLTRSPR
jgi:hypothetical protein